MISHNRSVDLCNPFEAVMHYLLIEGMTGIGHRDEFPMITLLVCMVTYWIRPTVSHDLRLSSSHDFNKLLHCIVS